MSFPRRVPLAKRKVDYTIRNRVLRAGMAYTVGTALVGEYFGWWDRFDLRDIHSGSEAELCVEQTQREDEKSWGRWGFRMMGRTQEKAKKFADEQFVANLPTGVQHYINDPKYQVDYYKKKQLGLIKDEDENPTIELYDTAPGFAPTILKKEDVIVFTSSKQEVNASPEPS